MIWMISIPLVLSGMRTNPFRELLKSSYPNKVLKGKKTGFQP
jgi:hypothetical protein